MVVEATTLSPAAIIRSPRAGVRLALLRIAGFIAICLLFAACSGESGPAGPTPTPVAPVNGDLTVVTSEWGFDPPNIVLQQSEEVRLVLQNNGAILHNLKVDDLLVDVIEEISTGGFSGDDETLFVGAASDDVGLLTFVPLEPGEYEFFCTISNHRQLGMRGVLSVE